MDPVKMKISGNVIGELSEKIPSILVALEELIKNSYDAGATSCSIEINNNTSLLTITDDGEGMDETDIKKLFHIAKSEKKYGTISKYDRYIQGSKGLGFLAVFKFGEEVTWQTKKENHAGFSFSVNYRKIIENDDISKIEITLDSTNILPKGTTISINLTTYVLGQLNDYFTKPENREKLLGSFLDDSFTITITQNSKSYLSKNLRPPESNAKQYQFLRVSYNNEKSIIQYYSGDKILHEEKFKIEDKRFSLSLKIILFYFKSHGTSYISDQYKHNGELTPLVYVNNNFFNNYELFDPQIMRSVKTDLVFAQMIGYIKIYCNNREFNFNSDRTRLIQSELTDKIKDDIERLNKKIQTDASHYKKILYNNPPAFLIRTLLPNDDRDQINDPKYFRKYIDPNIPFKDKIEVSIRDDGVLFSLFGNKKYSVKAMFKQPKAPIPPPTPKKAIIELKSYELTLDIPSEQLDLTSYISKASDSRGKPISFSDIKIKESGTLMNNLIIESVESPCTKEFTYLYTDQVTGQVIRKLKIHFNLPSSRLTGQAGKESIINIPCKEGYKISFDLVVSNLLNQINKLPIINYREVLACSIRALFELGIKNIKHKNPGNIENKASLKETSLDSNVKNLISYISSQNTIITEIDNNSGIGYKTLSNLFRNSDDYFNVIKKAHLGAHNSTTFLSDSDIQDLGKKVAIFLVITNEICNNKVTIP